MKATKRGKAVRTPPYEETCEHGVNYGGQDCFGCHPNHPALKTLRYLLSDEMGVMTQGQGVSSGASNADDSLQNEVAPPSSYQAENKGT